MPGLSNSKSISLSASKDTASSMSLAGSSLSAVGSLLTENDELYAKVQEALARRAFLDARHRQLCYRLQEVRNCSPRMTELE